MERKITSIRVSMNTRLRLGTAGNAGESLDTVLNRVLDLYEEIKIERLLKEKMR